MPDLIDNLRSSARAFRAHPVYTVDGDAVRLTAQAEEMDRAALLLEQGAAWFDEYAEHHAANGAGEKAERNRARALTLRDGNGQITLQERVRPWMAACFGPEISADELERCDRFVEEAIELVQAKGYDRARITALIDYVYGRPAGDPHQEVGGVMITLAALCLAAGLDMHRAGEDELARIWTKVDQIRAKQATKPHGSALPVRQHNPDCRRGKANAVGIPCEPHGAEVCYTCDPCTCGVPS